jgi:hypothetical protein
MRSKPTVIKNSGILTFKNIHAGSPAFLIYFGILIYKGFALFILVKTTQTFLYSTIKSKAYGTGTDDPRTDG